MMEYDVLLKNGNIYGGGLLLQKDVDMAIRDGAIVKIDKAIEGRAKLEIDITDKMICPGYIDSHMHIDKALLKPEEKTDTLFSACDSSRAYAEAKYAGWNDSDIYGDIIERSGTILDMCIANGTTAVKTHVSLGGVWKTLALTAMGELKEAYKDKITLFSVVPYEPEYDKEFREAAQKGHIDFIGGCPCLDYDAYKQKTTANSDPKAYIDKVFELANCYDLPIDMHIDESDKADIDAFLYTIDKTMKMKMQGRVTASHVTALDAIGMDPIDIGVAVARCAKARVNVVSLTSCNLYLMEWGRRGPTRVRDLLDAGVSVSIASDNIQDAFRPYGNANLIEEALLTAQVHKFTTHAEFARLFEMITYNPAENTLLENYGTLKGCTADIVVVDACDTTEAILSKSKALYVFKKGALVAKEGIVL